LILVDIATGAIKKTLSHINMDQSKYLAKEQFLFPTSSTVYFGYTSGTNY